MGRRQESTDTAYHGLVTNKLRTTLADETHPLRPEFDNIDTQTGAVGLGFLVVGQLDTYMHVHSNGHSDTQSTSRQINATRISGDVCAATTKGGRMEECLRVNVRPVVRVDCNLEERECESLVQFLICSHNTFYGRHLIFAMDE